MSNRKISFLLVLSFCFLLGMATKAEVGDMKEEVEGKETIVDSTNAIVGDNEIIPLENWERDKEIDKEVYKIANELEKWCERAKGDYEAIGWNLTAVRLIKKLDELGKDALPASYEIAKDRNRNELLRILMIEGLGASREPAVTSPLVNFLMDKSESERIRVNVADWLGRIKDTTATTALIGTMEDKSNPEKVRWEAAHAFVFIYDERAVEPLLDNVKLDPSLDVKRISISALGAIGRETDNREMVKPLLEIVEKGDNKILQYHAISSLGAMKEEKVIPLLSEIVNSEKKPNLSVTIWALGNIGDSEAKKLLLNITIDKKIEDWIRFGAAKALIKTKDKSVIPKLSEALISFEDEYLKRMLSDSLEGLKRSTE